jgi:hypothetical protein
VNEQKGFDLIAEYLIAAPFIQGTWFPADPKGDTLDTVRRDWVCISSVALVTRQGGVDAPAART